jgi:hypothetical protein
MSISINDQNAPSTKPCLAAPAFSERQTKLRGSAKPVCDRAHTFIRSAARAVIISDDRFFLDRIATHMLAFEGDSHVEWFEGNFADYEEDKKRRLGIDSVTPHRLKYKKFSR